MLVELGQIADIRTGYTIRKESDWINQGERILMQMSDFEALRKGSFEKFKMTNMRVRSEWTLEESDLLIKGRGSDFAPIIVPKSFQGAVYTHPLLRIRVDSTRANSEYIVWLLSQPKIQAQLNRMTAGTSLQILKLEQLKNLELTLPTLERQHKLCEIVRLANQEQHILNQLQIKRKQLVCCMIEQFTTE
jgi:hypothetical protein